MARLIDSDALMGVIRQNEYCLATKHGSVDYGMFTLGIQQAVDEQPTIDAVPVVRCRECKYHNKPPCPMRLSFNWTEDNDFCSYGERNDGDGNG